MSDFTVSFRLLTAVPTGGTFAIAYPSGTNRGTFARGTRHSMYAIQNEYRSPAGIGVVLGATAATVTYRGATTLPAGTEVFFQFDVGAVSFREGFDVGVPLNTGIAYPMFLDLGNPIAGSANSILLSAAVTAAAPVLEGSFTGAAAVGGRVTLDVPRNVVAAWTTVAVLTVDGFDVYGRPMREVSASGTSFAGVKAFSRVTRVAFNANVTGATVGTGNALGLPIRLVGAGHVLRELQDGAVPTAGTIVPGLVHSTPSAGNTADVRGTYTPNATPNGTIAFGIIIAASDPSDFGNPQFAG
jgi:hypothetical protein